METIENVEFEKIIPKPKLFFTYWVDANTGHRNSGFQILHVDSHKELYDRMLEEGRVEARGLYWRVVDYVNNEIDKKTENKHFPKYT